MKLLEVRKIWDQAEHNAFTDLIRFKESWFCVLRESSGHTANDGSLRVITSDDGETWESAALITSSNSDLRDAKITETPEGELMLCGAESLHDKTHHSHQTLAWFSKDGLTWSDRHEIADKDFWLWRVTWHKGTAYGVAYSVGNERDNHGFARLYASKDGKRSILSSTTCSMLGIRTSRRSSSVAIPPIACFGEMVSRFTAIRSQHCWACPSLRTPNGNGKIWGHVLVGRTLSRRLMVGL